eukprot:PhF_6_TR20523/c1_g1_i2/m.29605
MTSSQYKFVLKRSTGDEVHRLRDPDMTFGKLQDLVASWWPSTTPTQMVFQYCDDEGDTVNVSSAVEWEECVRCQTTTGPRNALIRVTVLRNNHSRRLRVSDVIDAVVPSQDTNPTDIVENIKTNDVVIPREVPVAAAPQLDQISTVIPPVVNVLNSFVPTLPIPKAVETVQPPQQMATHDDDEEYVDDDWDFENANIDNEDPWDTSIAEGKKEKSEVVFVAPAGDVFFDSIISILPHLSMEEVHTLRVVSKGNVQQAVNTYWGQNH